MAASIGAQLKQIRESQGISLETISQKTHISLAYLKAIEIGDEEFLPSRVHLRGFLRLYA
ncbi:MAG: helix-turn-helix domain-containing protein, partial [Brevefilum sp.]|nr:helix-turn-helix domain-containing protein [Brevefilum sp.]